MNSLFFNRTKPKRRNEVLTITFVELVLQPVILVTSVERFSTSLSMVSTTTSQLDAATNWFTTSTLKQTWISSCITIQKCLTTKNLNAPSPSKLTEKSFTQEANELMEVSMSKSTISWSLFLMKAHPGSNTYGYSPISFTLYFCKTSREGVFKNIDEFSVGF